MYNLCLCMFTVSVIHPSSTASLSVALALLDPLSLGEGGGYVPCAQLSSYLVIYV